MTWLTGACVKIMICLPCALTGATQLSAMGAMMGQWPCRVPAEMTHPDFCRIYARSTFQRLWKPRHASRCKDDRWKAVTELQVARFYNSAGGISVIQALMAVQAELLVHLRVTLHPSLK